jgi:hypothetical protein
MFNSAGRRPSELSGGVWSSACRACFARDRNRSSGQPVDRFAAGLNSIPVLILAFVFVICLQVLKVSYKRSNNQRDRKGKVSRMESMAVSFGGRSAVSLAAIYSTLVGALALSGGSG